MHLKSITYIILLMLFTFSCEDNKIDKKKSINTNTQKVKSTKNENLNISFLLDLSDRIDPKKYPNGSMEFYLRDVAYIKSASGAFVNHLQHKKVRQMNDNIQLYFDPEPKNENINRLSDSLRYQIHKSNATEALINEIADAYSIKTQNIYESAIKDNNYIGSDTWRFFKTKINDFCILESHRNILIILTDGYIYHKNTLIEEENRTSFLTPQLIRKHKLNTKNWKEKIEKQHLGFITATENLENLEILVLGIHPDIKNPYEEDVIVTYWADWFERMNVKKYQIKTAMLPSNLDKIITDFINNNK